MTTFDFAAIRRDGTSVAGRRRSRSTGEVRRWLEARDLKPEDIAEVDRSWRIEIISPRTDRKVLVHFTRQLAAFIRSGIQLVPALHILSDECEDRALRRALQVMTDEIVTGETLSRAAERHPRVFPHHYVGLLRSAEGTGRLDETLSGLAESLQRDVDTRATIIGALAYPAIVVLLSLATVGILTGYVLPRFQPLFDELGADLPTTTRVLLETSALITDRPVVSLGMPALGLVLVIALLASDRGRRISDRVMLRVPVVRELVQFVALERFCRILASTVKGGIPVPEGMKLGTQAIRNTEVRRRLEVARVGVERGRGFADPLGDSGLFPAATCLMFRVGEETGTLEDQLAGASGYLEMELAQRIRRFTALFEPAMIIGVGLTVGFVAVALVSAMYGVIDGVEQTP